MAEAGLVAPGQAGARDARPYLIVVAGRSAFAAWLHAARARRRPHPAAAEARLCRRLDPDRLAAVLATQRAEHAERLASYETSQAALLELGATPAAAGDPARFGMACERAVLGWFDGF